MKVEIGVKPAIHRKLRKRDVDRFSLTALRKKQCLFFFIVIQCLESLPFTTVSI